MAHIRQESRLHPIRLLGFFPRRDQDLLRILDILDIQT